VNSSSSRSLAKIENDCLLFESGWKKQKVNRGLQCSRAGCGSASLHQDSGVTSAIHRHRPSPPLKRVSIHLHVKNCHVTTPFSTSLGPRHTQSTMPGSESHHDNRRMRSASPTQSGLWETAQRFYSKSYAGDYIGLVMLLVVLTFFEFSGEPFHQMFTIDDPRIQHPHAEVERVPVRKFRKSLTLVSTQSL
jgi:hypothetical protein